MTCQMSINSATLAMFADNSECYRIINNDADFSKLHAAEFRFAYNLVLVK